MVVFQRSRRELSLDVSVGVHIPLVVEQSSLERQSRGCAKTPMLTVFNPANDSDAIILPFEPHVFLSFPSLVTTAGRPGGSVGNLESF